MLHVASHGEHLDRSDPRSAALLLADGPLRILEIEVRRELQARRPLVILAACESAATGDDAVDEIVGLPLAWMEAGAGAVIANQWSVGDKPMRKLLGTFYERWLDEGRAPWQALGDAMRQARRETGWSGAGSDPASWAALTFWG